MKLLVASRNPKKLRELQRVLDQETNRSGASATIELLSLADVADYPERPENGRTFHDNALIKATDGARATGLPCLADDSGLAIDELGGMPGVLSARWSGSHGDDDANLELVLKQMADVPEQRRQAEFVSTCVVVFPGSQEPLSVTGRWPGRIVTERIGTGGFGYDPIFVPEEEDAKAREAGDSGSSGGGTSEGGAYVARTAAQLSPEEKDALSHRGRALRQLVPLLVQRLEQGE